MTWPRLRPPGQEDVLLAVLLVSAGASNGNPGPADPETLRAARAAMIDSQRLEKKYLTVSSVAGTLVWGFSDRIALCLGASG